MSLRVTFEDLLAQKRPHVERVIQDLARRHYLASTEIQEFRGAVERALERNQYELLKAFDGRCTWETYLDTVVTRQFFLFQAAMWGQWRPSNTALRTGAAAVLLEELVVRDRFSVGDAIDWMRTSHRVDQPRPKLQQMAERLGLCAAPGRRPAAVPTPSPVDADLRAVLGEALASLSADDRLVVELRFRDSQPLTRIAAVLNLAARPLQRRIDAITQTLRDVLRARGIDAVDIETLLRTSAHESAATQQHCWNLVPMRPSKEAKL